MSDTLDLYIFGAGSHGLVVAEAAEATGRFKVVALVDDRSTPSSRHDLQESASSPWHVTSRDEITPDRGSRIFVAVGDNAARARITRELLDTGWELANVIHPTAWVSPTARLGRGVYVGPHAAINAQAKIGDGVILNTGCIVEHHCEVQRFAHCCPRSAMAGHVTVGQMTLLGTGACVRPRVTIGSNCVVGAGAAVVRDIPQGRLAMGVPASCVEAFEDTQLA